MGYHGFQTCVCVSLQAHLRDPKRPDDSPENKLVRPGQLQPSMGPRLTRVVPDVKDLLLSLIV